MDVTHLPSPPLRATGRVPSGTASAAGLAQKVSCPGNLWVLGKPGLLVTYLIQHTSLTFSKVWPPNLAVGTLLPPSLASLTVESGVEMTLSSA